MDLREFISDPDRKRRLAVATGRSEGYLWQIATSWRDKKPSAELAIVIEAQSALIGPDAVPRGSLRPDLWPSSEAA